jgi:hypothetical protein
VPKKTCPVCKGSGHLEKGWHDINEAQAKAVMARALIKDGYSYREAARLCGFKSVRSVQIAVKTAQ